MKVLDVAETLLRASVSPDIVSDSLDLPLKVVVTLREDLGITIEDDMNEAMSRLAWRAYNSAIEILETGSPQMRMMLIRMMLSSMRGLMNTQSPKEMAELVAQFRGAIEVDPDEFDDPADSPSDATPDEKSAS